MKKKITFLVGPDGIAARKDWPGMRFRDCPECGTKMGQRGMVGHDNMISYWECWGVECLRRDAPSCAFVKPDGDVIYSGPIKSCSVVAHPCIYSECEFIQVEDVCKAITHRHRYKYGHPVKTMIARYSTGSPISEPVQVMYEAVGICSCGHTNVRKIWKDK